jgi:molybdenum cofactor biosynthesis enzyme MoaA
MDEEDDLGSLAQGRFVVHAKGMRDQVFHEVNVDFQDAQVDAKENKFIKRGDF